MDMKTRADRILGCLMGGAIGDAIGAHYEGSAPVSGTDPNESPKPMWELDLCVTDDTQLTLATCEAIVQAGRVDPDTIAERFVAWFQARRITGIGSSTLKALTELAAGGHWALVGASGERSAGNGAAMRIAPLAFFLDPTSDADRRTLHDVCRITHRNEEAYCGALAMLASIRLAAEGISLKQELLPRVVELLPDSVTRDRLKQIHVERLKPFDAFKRFGSSGYVADSVPVALAHAIQNPFMITAMMGAICASGGDTDTIGSMAGQIVGASKGGTGLQNEQGIFESIDLAQEVTKLAKSLAMVPT
ncbi:ADP-ribosylglycohydrolase family protein [Blastopirellula sp. JC732]|uniref:ADP-ribosylglycohydrolase family protein n=1 Tax=Blastopirellula sediminis TaxID=2894196 RepID=A0A9X1MIT1_9BACT|nr:ADP-ribosylglycohydrolase family protein [Blastopirellula sediminis]MCC9609678.1 ADP-ribosylglycohydrolase family protein [Blastopirellula sediminis]MCC9627546.1 ADP-ribosylglycohydrolase family protein [Blastopirellula sediminis]